MKLQKITDRILMLPGDHYTDRPNLYYVKGDARSLAVDAGASPAHVEAFYAALRAEGLPLPEVTVITHWHWDHTFGMCAVNGRTYASAGTFANLFCMQKWAWDRPSMQQRELQGQDIAFCNMCIMREYAAEPSRIRVALPDSVLITDETIDLGGITARLLNAPSPHSEDQLSVYIPEEKALFVGDGDCSDHYRCGGMFQEESLAKWICFLEGIDHTHHLEGHGEPTDKEEALGYLHSELALCRREAAGRALVQEYRRDYIPKLRSHVGHAPLHITGCSVLLENEKGELLLQKRRDNGCWAPPGGALEMGETAENAARRECWEEAGVVAGELRLFGVYTGEDRYIYYPNGDVCYCTLVCFTCKDYVGDPMQNTEEAVEHRFFARDDLPENLNRCDERSIRDWAAGTSSVVCR